MHVTPTGIDNIAAILGIIIAVVSLLTLLGMGGLMAAGAVFSRRPLVTSWANEQEHAFTPFEERGASANSAAWTASLIGAGIVSLIALGVYFGVKPEQKDLGKDMNMSNLTKKQAVAAPKPDAAKAEPAAAKAEPAAPAAAPADDK